MQSRNMISHILFRCRGWSYLIILQCSRKCWTWTESQESSWILLVLTFLGNQSLVMTSTRWTSFFQPLWIPLHLADTLLDWSCRRTSIYLISEDLRRSSPSIGSHMWWPSILSEMLFSWTLTRSRKLSLLTLGSVDWEVELTYLHTYIYTHKFVQTSLLKWTRWLCQAYSPGQCPHVVQVFCRIESIRHRRCWRGWGSHWTRCFRTHLMRTLSNIPRIHTFDTYSFLLADDWW